VIVDGEAGVSPPDLRLLRDFQQKVARLQRAVAGALEAANSLGNHLEQIKRTLDHTPSVESHWKGVARTLERRNHEILRALRGDTVLRGHNENTPPAIAERVANIVDGERFSLARPTVTQVDGYRIASQEFGEELAKLRTLITVDLRNLE